MDGLPPLTDLFELASYVRACVASGEPVDDLQLVDSVPRPCKCGCAFFTAVETPTSADNAEVVQRYYCSACFDRVCRKMLEDKRAALWTNWIQAASGFISVPNANDAHGRISECYADAETVQAVLEVARKGEGAVFAIEAMYKEVCSLAEMLRPLYPNTNGQGSVGENDDMFSRFLSALEELAIPAM